MRDGRNSGRAASLGLVPRELAGVALEALADDSDDVQRRLELLVLEAVQQRGQPNVLGDLRRGELGAAFWSKQRLKDSLVLRIRGELDNPRADSRVRELSSSLLSN